MSQYSVGELIECVRRELGQRRRVYRRMEKEGKMEPEEALREIGMMEAILEKLEEEMELRLF